MAKHQGTVYLGYEEENINEKNQSLTNYSVNKIGGFPDWPLKENIQFVAKCTLCGLHRLLVVQCYAPIENSIYHRTLYVFACINPNCWIQSESWACYRSQIQDNTSSIGNPTVVAMPSETNLAWCNGADEWDENDNGDSANGNIMNVDNAPSPNNSMQRYSDEEESNSFEVETVEQAFGNLQMFDAHNANMSPVQGAVGAIGVPIAAAELEGGDEPGLVIVDSPTAPTNDLETLLHMPAELPTDIRSRLNCGPMKFVPKFIYVEEEYKRPTNIYGDDKVTELLNKYKKENEMESCMGDKAAGGGGGGGGGDDEQYEEAVPLHGDRMFHAFLSRLRENPGQILRYSRDAPPLLGAPLPQCGAAALGGCARCGAALRAELQLLPALAPTLRLSHTNAPLPYLHFLSVLVLTCESSCWQPGDSVVPETVVFQPEV